MRTDALQFERGSDISMIAPKQPTGTENPNPTAFECDKALATARAIAHRLRRRGAIESGEVDDVVGELVLRALERWPRYDASRGAVATFLSVVMNRAAAAMLRSRRVASRGYGCNVSLNQEVEIPASGEHRSSRLGVSTRGHTERVGLRLDVHEAILRLPTHLRPYCALLMSLPLTEAARELGVPRHLLESKARQIRRQFAAVRLEEYIR